MGLQPIMPYFLITVLIWGTLGPAWLINPDAVPIAAIGLAIGTAASYLITRCLT